MSFHFDPVEHKYYLDGIEIPGATSILKSCGLIDDRYYSPESADRGRRVHLACQYLSEGDLDWESLGEDIRGYVEGFGEFLQAYKFQGIELEVPIYHPVMRYGTTPDQIGNFHPIGTPNPVLVEIKSGSLMEWTALQTALQAMARWPADYLEIHRLGVELKKNGLSKVVPFDDPADFDVAIALVTTVNAQKKYRR